MFRQSLGNAVTKTRQAPFMQQTPRFFSPLRAAVGIHPALGLALMVLMAPAVWAQVSPSQPVAAVSPTARVAGPWQVLDVVAEVSGSVGFNRDVALAQAARSALPTVLVRDAGLPEAQARSRAASLGDAMKFVSRYALVQETLVPNYRLVADLTFDAQMIRRNFGAVSATQPAPQTPVTGASPTAAVSAVAPAPNPATSWTVTLRTPDVALQDRARLALAALPETQVAIRRIGPQGLELEVATSQPQPELLAVLGPYGATLQPQALEVINVSEPARSGQVPAFDKPAETPARRPVPSWFPTFW